MNCLCKNYVGKNRSEVRASEGYSEARANLVEIAKEPNTGFSRRVLRCKICDTLWGTSFENIGISTIEYVFPIENTEPMLWIEQQRAKEKVDGEEARKNWNLTEYKKFLNFPRVNERCRSPECKRDRMKLSVFCPFHHWENSSGPLPDYLAELPVK